MSRASMVLVPFRRESAYSFNWSGSARRQGNWRALPVIHGCRQWLCAIAFQASGPWHAARRGLGQSTTRHVRKLKFKNLRGDGTDWLRTASGQGGKGGGSNICPVLYRGDKTGLLELDHCWGASFLNPCKALMTTLASCVQSKDKAQIDRNFLSECLCQHCDNLSIS